MAVLSENKAISASRLKLRAECQLLGLGIFLYFVQEIGNVLILFNKPAYQNVLIMFKECPFLIILFSLFFIHAQL